MEARVLMLSVSPEMLFCATLCEATQHDVVSSAIPPEALSELPAQNLYQAALTVAAKHSQVTTARIIEELEERGVLGATGGAEAISVLVALHGREDRKNARDGLLRAATRRLTSEVGRDLVVAAAEGRMADGVAELEGALQTVQRFAGAQHAAPFKSARDHLLSLSAQLATILQKPDEQPPRADLGVLSRPLGTPKPGTMVVVGGYSHAGKSHLFQWLERKYVDAGLTTLRLSLEDADPITEQRLGAEFSGWDYSDLWRSPDRLSQQLNGRIATLRASDLDRRLIVTPENRELSYLLRDMRRAKEEHGVSVVFVDFIQEVQVPEARDLRMAIIRAVGMLKQEAIRLGLTLFIGSQFRKPPTTDPTYEPTPHDLKEASELYHSSDVLLLLWKTEKSDGGSRRLGKVAKDKLTGSYPRFEMRTGVGGVVSHLLPMDKMAPVSNRHSDEEAAE